MNDSVTLTPGQSLFVQTELRYLASGEMWTRGLKVSCRYSSVNINTQVINMSDNIYKLYMITVAAADKKKKSSCCYLSTSRSYVPPARRSGPDGDTDSFYSLTGQTHQLIAHWDYNWFTVKTVVNRRNSSFMWSEHSLSRFLIKEALNSRLKSSSLLLFHRQPGETLNHHRSAEMSFKQQFESNMKQNQRELKHLLIVRLNWGVSEPLSVWDSHAQTDPPSCPGSKYEATAAVSLACHKGTKSTNQQLKHH